MLPASAQGNLVEREEVGRAVWEYFEAELKKWEEEEKIHLETINHDAKVAAATVADKGKANQKELSSNRRSFKDE